MLKKGWEETPKRERERMANELFISVYDFVLSLDLWRFCSIDDGSKWYLQPESGLHWK